MKGIFRKAFEYIFVGVIGYVVFAGFYLWQFHKPNKTAFDPDRYLASSDASSPKQKKFNFRIICSACDGLAVVHTAKPGKSALGHLGVNTENPIIMHCLSIDEESSGLSCFKENSSGEDQRNYNLVDATRDSLIFMGGAEMLSLDFTHSSAAFGFLKRDTITGKSKADILMTKMCSCTLTKK